MKTKKIIKPVVIYLLPLIATIMLFSYNALTGAAFLLAYLAFIVFTGRAGIYALFGSISYTKGNYNEALKWFNKAYTSNKAKPKTIISYAYLLLKSGNIEKPEEILRKLIVSTAAATDEANLARSNLALVLWKKGCLDEAIAMLEEVFGSYKTTTIYGSLGYLLTQAGDLDKALQFNLEAYDYNSSNTIILDNLGHTYYLLGQYEKACVIYDKLLSLKPTFPEAYFNYGLLLAAMNEPENGLQEMQKALKYNFSLLSTVTMEDVKAKINELEEYLQN